MLCSLPRMRLCLRTPKIWAILSAVRRNNPNSQERSKILWMGKCRRNRKLRQYSTWFSEYSRRRGMAARSFWENFGPSNAHHHGPQHFVADVEVIMRVAGSVPAENAVIGVVRRILRRHGTEGRPMFQALEDEVYAEPVAPLHGETVGADEILLVHVSLL